MVKIHWSNHIVEEAIYQTKLDMMEQFPGLFQLPGNS